MQTQFTGTIPNSAGVKKLTIGVTGRDGKRAALEFKAENTSAPLVAVISGIETDGGDASPEPPTPETRNVIIPFTGPQPSAYDSLGEIKWNCINPFCHTCQRDLRACDVYFRSQYYDGCHWEQPTCVYCQMSITDCNYPDDENERRLFISRMTLPDVHFSNGETPLGDEMFGGE